MDSSKKQRKIIRNLKKRRNVKNVAKEGKTYDSGAFDYFT